MKLYGLYRQVYTDPSNKYSMSYYLNEELSDYVSVDVLSVYDNVLPENAYTQELAPGVINKARFFIAEYNEQAVPQKYVDMLKKRIETLYYGEFFEDVNGDVDVEATRQRLRNNTDRVESPTGTFETHPPIPGQGFDGVYITID